MITLTHAQLELLSGFIDTIKSPQSYPLNSQFADLKASFHNRVTRSKLVYSITLRYPTTQVDDSDIHWIIKNAMPTTAQLSEFYSAKGLV